jgi:hypothetical protein
VSGEYLLSSESDNWLWDEFITHCPTGTPFARTSFLSAMKLEPRRILFSESGKVDAVCLVQQNAVGEIQPDLSAAMYQGIFFNPEIFASQSKLADSLKKVLEALVKENISFAFELHPGLTDMRPVNWVNRTLLNSDSKIQIDVRYTGIIDFKEFSSKEEVRLQVKQKRIREIMKNPIQISNEGTATDFYDLYVASFAKKDVFFSPARKNELRRNFEYALSQNDSYCNFARNSEGKIVASTLNLQANQTSFYWFSATDPNNKLGSPNSALLLDQIENAFQKGLRYFDFCGINSKEIGSFKMSFGGEIRPYYRISWTAR